MSLMNYIEHLNDWDNIYKDYDRIPDRCPICNYSVEPVPVLRYVKPNTLRFVYNYSDIVCLCPRNECSGLFIANFRKQSLSFDHNRKFQLFNYAPIRLTDRIFDDSVSELSPSFTKIYNQAMHAELHGLNEVAGVGYRKSLEFLLKDYSISRNPNEEEAIKSMFLGKCISSFIGDKRIKECARRAIWLGNDETHYVRLWEDKDIKDLKILIELTLNWILLEVQTEFFLNDMEH
mgnify:CR=1 FL=1